MMKRSAFAPLALALLACCDRQAAQDAGEGASLVALRQGHSTTLTRRVSIGEPAPDPPANLFASVRYPSPAGDLAAYVSHPPPGGGKYPAIV